MSQVASLDDLLRQCTARIIAGSSSGTGFFVAPGQILTCTHVVESAPESSASITVAWLGRSYAATPLQILPKEYPDLALLAVELTEHPCVFLDTGKTIGDEIYSYGYTDEYPHGDSALFVYEGPADELNSLLRLRDAQARPGLSGAPLLDRRTGTVCGLVKRSRDRGSSLGARAVPTEAILTGLPTLSTQQRAFHMQDHRWRAALKSARLEPPRWYASQFQQDIQIPVAYLTVLDLSKEFVKPTHFTLDIPSWIFRNRVAGESVEEQVCTIGCSPDRDIRIEPWKIRVSGKHARICARIDAGQSWFFRLYDGNSTKRSANGTFVNGRQIEHFHDLHNDDLIGLSEGTEDEIFLRFTLRPKETPKA